MKVDEESRWERERQTERQREGERKTERRTEGIMLSLLMFVCESPQARPSRSSATTMSSSPSISLSLSHFVSGDVLCSDKAEGNRKRRRYNETLVLRPVIPRSESSSPPSVSLTEPHQLAHRATHRYRRQQRTAGQSHRNLPPLFRQVVGFVLV